MSLPRLFIAIDTADLEQAGSLARMVGDKAGIKLGLEFFSAHGPAGIAKVRRPGQRLFLDLKLHDIPNTVAGAVRSAMALQPDLLTIHAAGGRAMMQTAAEAAHATAAPAVVLAVTVLTSLDERALEEIGQRGPTAEQALRLAQLAQRAGIGGAVCSVHEIGALKAALGSDFRLAVPGLRPAGTERHDDQARVMTPTEAVRLGADWLVVGRSVTAAPDPAQALENILNEIAGAAP